MHLEIVDLSIESVNPPSAMFSIGYISVFPVSATRQSSNAGQLNKWRLCLPITWLLQNATSLLDSSFFNLYFNFCLRQTPSFQIRTLYETPKNLLSREEEIKAEFCRVVKGTKDLCCFAEGPYIHIYWFLLNLTVQ